MKHISEIDIYNKSILIRVDYNVPIINEKIINTFRIDSSLQTIRYCLDKGCKIILMSHLGRPEKQDLKYSLKPVFHYLDNIFKNKVYFSPDCISDNAVSLSKKMKSGEIHLLENLRFYKEELTCDKEFSEKLSRHGEIFINDAFGTAHRAHSSNVRIADCFEFKGCGFLISKEVKYLKEYIKKNNQGLTLLLGGSKISDKIRLISKFEDIADNILIAGAMSNNFLVARGLKVGKSLIQEDYIDLAKEIIMKNKDKVLIPLDFICSKDIDNLKDMRISNSDEIRDDEMTVDIGPATISKFKRIIKKTNCILWNGPMGIIEKKEFSIGTNEIINVIKEVSKNGVVSIIGGGDTSSIIKEADFKMFTHISTGGGASLKLLGGESMPAFEALK